MATFLSSALALAALLQAPAAQTPATGTAADSLVALREHLARDSTDGHAWLLLGRLYLQRAADAHEPPHHPLDDSARVRALLDTADDALDRAGQRLAPSGSTPDGDSAPRLPVGAWSARPRPAGGERGVNRRPPAGGPRPPGLEMPPGAAALGEEP